MTVTDGIASRSPAEFDRDGYFLVEDLVSPTDCDRFAERLQEYASGSREPTGSIRLQREPAVERAGKTLDDGGDIRKISGLFGDDLFRGLISSDEVGGPLREVLGSPLRLFRADALMKPAKLGSEKGVHQDAPYWPIRPMSMWSCWVPFDDATIDNGCLMVVPGSHREGPRPHVHTDDDFVIPSERYDIDAMETVPMKRGTGLFFHSLLLHASAANISGDPRRAVTMSYMGPGHDYTGDGSSPDYPVIGG